MGEPRRARTMGPHGMTLWCYAVAVVALGKVGAGVIGEPEADCAKIVKMVDELCLAETDDVRRSRGICHALESFTLQLLPLSQPLEYEPPHVEVEL